MDQQQCYKEAKEAVELVSAYLSGDKKEGVGEPVFYNKGSCHKEGGFQYSQRVTVEGHVYEVGIILKRDVC
jgi:hypothetical protein